MGEREATTGDSLDDSDGAGSAWRMLHLRRRSGQSLSTKGMGHTGLGGSGSEAPAHDWDEMMDRYTVNGRLLVNCENVYASRPDDGGQCAAKRRFHSVESGAVADNLRRQEGQKRPASRAQSKKDA